MVREPSEMCLEPEAGTNAVPTILVVEDEVLIRMDLAEHLRASGLAVVEAADAEEALSVLGSGAKVDLLLTDVRMPGAMDGWQLARTAKAHYPALKLIVCSGHAVPDAEMVEDLEIDAVFPKPYSCSEIEQCIRELLERAG